MEKKHNATCKICGKSYYSCMSCTDTIKLNPFKNFTDTAEHFKVFQVVRGLSTGVYNNDEAKEKLKNINLSDIESFRPHIRDIINSILKEDEAIKAEVITSIVEELATEEVIEEAIIETPAYSYKRNYKVNKEVKEEIE